MCSELFRIPVEYGGVPIFGFGVLLAIWAVVAPLILALLVRRHGWSGETRSFVPLLLLVGGAIYALPLLFSGGLPIRGYGLMVVIGATAGVALAAWRARQVGLNYEHILTVAFWMFLCGVVAARLFYVIEYWQRDFAGRDLRQTVLAVLNFPAGGLVVYGALIGAGLAFIAYARLKKLPLLPLADLVAPSLVVGLAFGRIGCLLNGCCFGGQTDLPWAVTFPKYSSRYEAQKPLDASPGFSPPYVDQAARGEMHGFRFEFRDDRPVVVRVDPDSPAAAAGLNVGDVIKSVNGLPAGTEQLAEGLIFGIFVEGQPLRLTLDSGRLVGIAPAPIPERSHPVHPTQVYSAVNAGLIAWFLWSFYPLRRRDGAVVALLLTIYPVTRFLLEIIRTDESAVFGTGLSISQNISLLVLVFALGLWWYVLSRPRPTHDWSAGEPAQAGPARRRASP
jgi:phosphatidylglycerol:prolipoprotein diacylglycerol transferase